MKFFDNHHSPKEYGFLSRLLKIIKPPVWVVLLVSVQVSAKTFSQTITIHLKNASLPALAAALESQTEYRFMFTEDQVNKLGSKNVNYQDTDIKVILNDFMEGSGIGYRIMDNTIVLIPLRQQGLQQPPSSVRVHGVVSNADGTPLAGVTVSVRNTDRAVQTGADGSYSIMVHSDETLDFFYVGKKKMEVECKGRREINLKMSDEIHSLKEVVITGVFDKARESYTGAATVITKKELKAFGNRSVLNVIRNVDPSFNVIDDLQYGSDPNRLPDITIRGRSSMDVDLKELENDVNANSIANQPLFIMDGFEVSLRRVQDMDESQIEMITILKDASATSLYGSRGANGIVVITTKRPEPGKLKVTYKGDLNIEVPDFSSYNLMNAREKLEYEKAAAVYYSPFPEENQTLLELYNKRFIEIQRGVNTYWLKYPVQTGVGQRHSVRIDGGDDHFGYAGNIGYNHISGTMKGSGRKTTTGGMLFQYKTGNINFRNDLSLTFNKSTESPYGSFVDYTYMNPYDNPYNEDGSLKKTLTDITLTTYRKLFSTNPLYNSTLPTRNDAEYTQINNNFAIDWRLSDDLTMRGSIGVIKQNGESHRYLSADHTDFEQYVGENYNRRGRYEYGTNSYTSYEGDFTLNYNKVTGKHAIYAGLNYNFSDTESKSCLIIAEGFAALNMANLGMAMGYPRDSKPLTTQEHSRRLGGTVNINYTFDQRYFFDATGKIEGSSKFGKNKRVAPFWSAGMGWNLHHEDFLQGNSVVNTLRLRLSYGISGAQNFNAYQAMMTYRFYDDLNYKYWNGAYLLGIGNSDLAWQQTGQWNIGAEAGLFDNKLRINVDFYDKLTNDMLSDINIPISSGFNSYKANIGKVRNRGMELTANLYIIRNMPQGVMWSVSGSVSHNKNKILKISNSLEFLNEQLLTKSGSNPSFLFKEGQSMNTIFAVRSLGIDPATGKEIFVKHDGSKTFIWDAADKVPCGVNEPRFWGNLNSMFRYKQLSVNISFSYRLGGYIYNQTLIDKVENIDPSRNADARAFTGRWKNVGDHSLYKSVTDITTTQASSRFVMKENNFQCRSLNVNYDFDREWLASSIGFENLSIGVYLEDLFHISTIKQERGTYYPFARKYSLSVSARF